MENDSQIKLRPCNNNTHDMELLYLWANDPEVRNNSFSTSKIDMVTHVNWFKNKINDKNYKILFLLDGNIDVGVVRIALENRVAIISYSVSAEFRGKGYGTRIIREAEKYIKEENLADIIKAEVKPQNIASCSIFEKLKCKKEEINNHFVYTKEL